MLCTPSARLPLTNTSQIQILQSWSGRNIRSTSGKASVDYARTIFNAAAAAASTRQETIIDHNDAADEPLWGAHITNGQPIATKAGQQLCQCIQWIATCRRRIPKFAETAFLAKNEAEVLLAFYPKTLYLPHLLPPPPPLPSLSICCIAKIVFVRFRMLFSLFRSRFLLLILLGLFFGFQLFNDDRIRTRSANFPLCFFFLWFYANCLYVQLYSLANCI